MLLFIWPQESPKVVRKRESFPVRSFNQTVCPGEKCWGKCIPFFAGPCWAYKSSVLWELDEPLLHPPPQRHIICSRQGPTRRPTCLQAIQLGEKITGTEFDSRRRFNWLGKKFNKRGKTDLVTPTGGRKHGRAGCGEVMRSSVCLSANGALYAVLDSGGNAPPPRRCTMLPRKVNWRKRNTCKISLSK